jgi:hypothetical protein
MNAYIRTDSGKRLCYYVMKTERFEDCNTEFMGSVTSSVFFVGFD